MDAMKPSLANVFTANTTGTRNDVVLSFFYEWQSTNDGIQVDVFKEKVASVVFSLEDFKQLVNEMSNVMSQLKDKKSNGGTSK